MPQTHPRIQTLSYACPNVCLFLFPGTGKRLTRSGHLNACPYSMGVHPLHTLYPAGSYLAMLVSTQQGLSSTSFTPLTCSTCLVFCSLHSGFSGVNATVCLAQIPEQQPRSNCPMQMSIHKPRMGACQVRKSRQGKRPQEVTWLLLPTALNRHGMREHVVATVQSFIPL